MALRSTQRLTEMSTRLKAKGGRSVRLTTLPPPCAVVMKSGNLNFLEPSGPLQACNGTALPFFCIYACTYVCICVCVCVCVCMYIYIYFFFCWLNTHAPLQRSNTTCFIVPLCYFFVVGDAETNSVNGFPLQVSLLHCYILGTCTPKVYNICNRYNIYIYIYIYITVNMHVCVIRVPLKPDDRFL